MYFAAGLRRARAVRSCRCVAAVSFALIGIAPALLGQEVTRVSVDSTGVEGNAASDVPAISADGRFVAFLSNATNLIPGIHHQYFSQCFLHDRVAGTTECISVTPSGDVADGPCYTDAITGDGRYVAFASDATNLLARGGTGFVEIYLRDRVAGTTERVSIPSSGKPEDGNSFNPAISADGRIVAFASSASNLVDDDTNHSPDIFVHDRQTNRTERVSVSSSGDQGNGPSIAPSISADGMLVAFASSASDLVFGDVNGRPDIFVRDRATGTTERVSVNSRGGQADGDSHTCSISADGRSVAFVSSADNLAANDSNGQPDIFLHDRASGVTERVSLDSSGGELNGTCTSPSLSADGSVVSFASWATNAAPFDWNGVSDIFRRDRNAGTTTLVSENCAWVAGKGQSSANAISGDGTCVAFSSAATDLVDVDTNGEADVFVNDFTVPPVDASWSNYGTGFPGTLGIPTFTASAAPVFGTTISLDASNSSGTWSDGLLLIGLQSASIPTSAGGTLLVDPVMELLFVLLPAGRSFIEHFPRDPALCGLTLYLQVLELDRGAAYGISFTPGLQLTVGH